MRTILVGGDEDKIEAVDAVARADSNAVAGEETSHSADEVEVVLVLVVLHLIAPGLYHHTLRQARLRLQVARGACLLFPERVGLAGARLVWETGRILILDHLVEVHRHHTHTHTHNISVRINTSHKISRARVSYRTSTRASRTNGSTHKGKGKCMGKVKGTIHIETGEWVCRWEWGWACRWVWGCQWVWEWEWEWEACQWAVGHLVIWRACSTPSRPLARVRRRLREDMILVSLGQARLALIGNRRLMLRSRIRKWVSRVDSLVGTLRGRDREAKANLERMDGGMAVHRIAHQMSPPRCATDVSHRRDRRLSPNQEELNSARSAFIE